MPVVLHFIFLIMIVLCSEALSSDLDFFEKRIRPLLVQNCQECHGEDKQKGSLRLDHQRGWQVGGDSGPAIMPRKVTDSLLWKAVSYTDRDLKMPPKKKLSAEQLADLKQWIESGAVDPRVAPSLKGKSAIQPKADDRFWSFQSPEIIPAPNVKMSDWPVQQIDRYI